MSNVTYKKILDSDALGVRKETSSGSLKNSIMQGEQIIDGTWTIARWDRIIANDVVQKTGPLLPDASGYIPQGYIIDHAAKYHLISGPITALLLCAVGLAGYDHFQKEQHKLEIQREKNIVARQSSHGAIIKALEDKNFYRKTTDEKEQFVTQLNDRLKKSEDDLEKKFFANFKNASFKLNENEEIDIIYETLFNPANAFLAAWDSLFFATFNYWCGWIITATYFAAIGIGFAHLSLPISFGIPLIFGLGYLGYKMGHWYTHRYKETLPSDNETMNADKIMEVCLGIKKVVEAPLDEESKLSFIWNVFTTVFHASLIGCVSTFVQTQYMLWFCSDMLHNFLTLSPDLFGILSFVVSGLFALRAGYNAYNAKVNKPCDLQDIEVKENYDSKRTVDEINADIKQLQSIVDELQKELRNDENAFVRFLKNSANEINAILDSDYYKFWDYMMSSGFVMRVFLLPWCTSPFLPAALHMTMYATALSNPATLGLILGIAVIWATYRTYLKHQERKEQAKLAAEKPALLNKEKDLQVELGILLRKSASKSGERDEKASQSRFDINGSVFFSHTTCSAPDDVSSTKPLSRVSTPGKTGSAPSSPKKT